MFLCCLNLDSWNVRELLYLTPTLMLYLKRASAAVASEMLTDVYALWLAVMLHSLSHSALWQTASQGVGSTGC